MSPGSMHPNSRASKSFNDTERNGYLRTINLNALIACLAPTADGEIFDGNVAPIQN